MPQRYLPSAGNQSGSLEVTIMDKTAAPEAIKRSLLAECKKYVNRRIENAQEAIAAASDAAADDTKSSAGDKFETTREMMQQELTRHRQLLVDAKRMEEVLHNLDIRLHDGHAKLGSLVTTNHGIFFIAISAGQLQINGRSYWVISPVSPLGQRLVGMKTGEQVSFNSTTYAINGIT